MRGRVGTTRATQLIKRRNAAGKLGLPDPVIDGAASLPLLAGQTIDVTELPLPIVTLMTPATKSARLGVSGVATLG